MTSDTFELIPFLLSQSLRLSFPVSILLIISTQTLCFVIDDVGYFRGAMPTVWQNLQKSELSESALVPGLWKSETVSVRLLFVTVQTEATAQNPHQGPFQAPHLQIVPNKDFSFLSFLFSSRYPSEVHERASTSTVLVCSCNDSVVLLF